MPARAPRLAGTAFPIDREATAGGARLRPARGQLARCRVGPRLRGRVPRAAALAGSHLSRFAEEIVLWSSDAFGYIR
jgi:argininosuccinate lyase